MRTDAHAEISDMKYGICQRGTPNWQTWHAKLSDAARRIVKRGTPRFSCPSAASSRTAHKKSPFPFGKRHKKSSSVCRGA